MPETETVNSMEYSRDRTPRQARSNGASTTRLRSIYFVLAALWGFLTGIGAVAAGSHLGGTPLQIGAWTVGVAVPGIALAMLGGIVVGNAYREARERRRK